MDWAKPRYSRQEINVAGKALSTYYATPVWDMDRWFAYDSALPLINNWRASHNYPLNTFKVNLRRSAQAVDEGALVAQRIKRLSSIALKLSRFPSMRLSQMQDLGGCRAVVKSVAGVRKLHGLYQTSRIKHKLATCDDYISQPKASGYRGIHLVYRYHSDDKNARIYNDLKIEMQLRSIYQHAWATAVETVGTFVRQALKSSMGQDEWLRFFALMGSAIAIRERTPTIPGTPATRADLIDELEHYVVELDVENRLRTYGAALQQLDEPSAQRAKSHYFLLNLEPRANKITVTGFKGTEFERATEEYLALEKNAQENNSDAVLVSVSSLASLRRAYPNYFADTRVFLELMKQAASGKQKRVFTRQLGLDL